MIELRQRLKTEDTYVKLFSDSQAALKSLAKNKVKWHVVGQTMRELNTTGALVNRLQLDWIKAHTLKLKLNLFHTSLACMNKQLEKQQLKINLKALSRGADKGRARPSVSYQFSSVPQIQSDAISSMLLGQDPPRFSKSKGGIQAAPFHWSQHSLYTAKRPRTAEERGQQKVYIPYTRSLLEPDVGG